MSNQIKPTPNQPQVSPFEKAVTPYILDEESICSLLTYPTRATRITSRATRTNPRVTTGVPPGMILVVLVFLGVVLVVLEVILVVLKV